MSNETHQHIVKYRTYLIVLVVLLVLTSISVYVTHIELGRLAIAGALLIASVKSSLVLWHFMHLKYESLLLRILVGMVFVLFALIVLITFIDYAYR